MSTLTIAWHGLDLNVDGYNIYRSDTPIDPNNLPSPIASVGPNIGSYDDNNINSGKIYYYRIGSIQGASEAIGKEQKLFAGTFIMVTASEDATARKVNFFSKEEWKYSFPRYKDDTYNTVFQSCAINGKEKTIYIGAGYNNYDLTKLDFYGNTLWKFKSQDQGNIDGHSGKIFNVAIDNNGNIITGSNDDTVKKIDSNGNHLWTFSVSGHGPTGLVVDSDNNVYSALSDNTLRTIDPDGNEIRKTGNFLSNANDITLSSSKEVYVASGNGIIQKIDVDGNEVTSEGWPFNGHTDDVNAITVDPNDNICSASKDGTVKKIDSNGNEIWTFSGHEAQVISIDSDSDGNVYSGGYYNDCMVKKIDPDGNEVWTFDGHVETSGYVYGLAVYLDY